MSTATDPLQAPLERVRALIEAADVAPTLQTLATAVQLSPSHLQRAFRRRFGMSPAEYHRARRFDHLKSSLRDGAGVAEAVYQAGFGSGSRVYENSDRLLGMTPASYRAGGTGANIRYTTLDTPLGRLLVAATERGICAVTLAADESAVMAQFTNEFPYAICTRVDEGREEWLQSVIARIAIDLGWRQGIAPPMPPLDIAATAFQWRVWQALTRIPRGTTVSYGALAKQLDKPGGARAVGNACGNNRLALVVPCHRVIREDGSLGGWRWGIERKQQLLAIEQQRLRLSPRDQSPSNAADG